MYEKGALRTEQGCAGVAACLFDHCFVQAGGAHMSLVRYFEQRLSEKKSADRYAWCVVLYYVLFIVLYLVVR